MSSGSPAWVFPQGLGNAAGTCPGSCSDSAFLSAPLCVAMEIAVRLVIMAGTQSHDPNEQWLFELALRKGS